MFAGITISSTRLPVAASVLPVGGTAPLRPTQRARSRRVLGLLLAIIGMSLGDLALTLTYLKTTGMGEANPIARLIIEYNSPGLLAAWKLATVLLACTIFYFLRQKRSTEVAAWFCVLILAALTFHWLRYTKELPELGPHIHAIAASDHTNWVQMTD